MTKRQAERYHYLLESTLRHGIGSVDLDTLLRCSRTLHRWAEDECNGWIERDTDSYILCSQGNCGERSYVDADTARHACCPKCGDPAPLKRHVATGKPYHVHEMVEVPWGTGGSLRTTSIRRRPIPDRESGALKRAEAIAKAHGLTIYHQSDPRGCSLYLIRPGDVPVGYTVDSCYTNGIAICID